MNGLCVIQKLLCFYNYYPILPRLEAVAKILEGSTGKPELPPRGPAPPVAPFTVLSTPLAGVRRAPAAPAAFNASTTGEADTKLMAIKAVKNLNYEFKRVKTYDALLTKESNENEFVRHSLNLTLKLNTFLNNCA